MLRNRSLMVAAVAVSLAGAGAVAQTPFTYQGQLKQNGQPFNGAANVTFSLYDAATGTGFIGDEVHNGVPVSNGLFTVELNDNGSWNNQFSGDIWLEVNVNGTMLSPRQKITAAPRAISAENLNLPFDSTENPSSSVPIMKIFNQGTGGALWGGTNNAAGNAVVGWNSATSGSASGVFGVSNQPGGFAVAGTQLASSGAAIGGFFTSPSPTGFGVIGRSLYSGSAANGSFGAKFENYAGSGFATGVEGMSTSNSNGFGVRGVALANNGFAIGTYGLSFSPQGYGGYFHNNAPGGIGVKVVGTAQVDVLQILGGSDLSEGFDVAGDAIQPGMVVSIDPANPGKLALATSAYDKKVAGIVSGAGGVNVGMIMGQDGSIASGKHPVALSGRVYCFADGGATGIEPGHPLTTSETPGHAMRALNSDLAQGAIIGKAMTSLKAGEKGLVLVLVNLQ
jgi:hypothetical protein